MGRTRLSCFSVVVYRSESKIDLETDSPIPWLKLFLLATWNAVQSSTHLICYFAIFHNAIINRFDYITITPVILILFWGLLSVPRPSKTFWIVLIVYMQVNRRITSGHTDQGRIYEEERDEGQDDFGSPEVS